jgi:cellobiose epimerase
MHRNWSLTGVVVLLACLISVAAAQDVPLDHSTAETYLRLADQVEKHWKSEMLAKWFPSCVDGEHGGFRPHFREDWSRGNQNDKTIVFQSRMTWVCVQVAMHYPELRAEYLKYTRHGVDFLARMWDQQHGGFFWGLDEHGQISDQYRGEKHVYGIGFAIYGLSAAYEATKDAHALDLAKRGFAWLDEHAHDAVHGGYYEALNSTGQPILSDSADAPSKQSHRSSDVIGTAYGFKSMNTHIHLLEALTELNRVWPDPLAQQRLQEVFLIVRDRIAVEPGCLNLFFTPDWRPVPDHDSFGHDIETGYLLLEAAEILKRPDDARTLAVARSLVDHALTWGWDEEHGGFYDKGAAFSAAWEKQKIWWTQAEGLNVLLLMHERFGSGTSRYWQAFLKQWQFIWDHQADHVHGGWYQSVSPEGVPKPGQAKGTVWKAAYHDGRALMNVSERLRHLAHLASGDGSCPAAAPLSPRQENQRRQQILENFFVPQPLPAIQTETHRRFQPAAGVTAEAVTYATEFGLRVPAILYLPDPLPKTASGKIPGFVVVNGHGGDKYAWYSFYAGVLYARAGAAVLTYDQAGEGERNKDRKSGTRAHDRIKGDAVLARQLAGLMITDVMQAVSYLQQRPEVDGRRIAAAGHSLGSFVVALTGAVDTRLHACVLVGGGNLDGPEGYWDTCIKTMCSALPYRSLSFLGDRPAAIYALHASRGPTLLWNGLRDDVMTIDKQGLSFFQDMRQRTIAIRGSAEGVFEMGFDPQASHRPYFLTRPVALWLKKQLDLPNWTEEAIRVMPETRSGQWAEKNGILIDRLYATEEREGGTPALGSDVPGYTRDELSVLSADEWQVRKREFILETWLQSAREAMEKP